MPLQKDETCNVCGLGGDSIVSCYSCSRSYHSYCLDPPLLYTPSIPWQCPNHEVLSVPFMHLILSQGQGSRCTRSDIQIRFLSQEAKTV